MKVKLLSKLAVPPQKAHAGDLGYDLFCNDEVVIPSGEVRLVSTGIAIQFPEGYGGLIRDRSSVSTNRTLFVVAGVIDSLYRGEIKVALYNGGPYTQYTKHGEKIAQLILLQTVGFEVEVVDTLENNGTRGIDGFGSTGA